jgi:ubiquinone/menaquinone biosynthesis C-methylase UbiE
MGADTGNRPPFSFDAVIFEPSIRHLIAAARPHAGESVLDAACGSGIAACKAGQMVGASGRVCGLDIGPNILKKAASLYVGPAPAAWVRGDLQHLPLGDGSFRLVLCHQGLQFASDPGAAVRELRRVTAPGGRAVISCWSHIADCPFYLTLRDVLGMRLGKGAAAFVTAPFSLPEEQELHGLLRTAFDRVSIERVTVRTVHPSAGAFAAGFLRYLPKDAADSGAVLAAAADVTGDMDKRLAPWQVDGPMIAPIVTHVAVCR